MTIVETCSEKRCVTMGTDSIEFLTGFWWIHRAHRAKALISNKIT
jgi:hypothetical protein